jgi:uncharacterized protein YjdB
LFVYLLSPKKTGPNHIIQLHIKGKIMKKLLSLTLLALIASFASYAIYPIVGTPGTCVGTYGYLSDSTVGGTWSSSNTAVATVDMSGNVLGISAGTVTISYTVGTAVETMLYTVSTHPAAIAGGPLSGCIGYTGALSDATPGGIWSSSAPSIATVGGTTGVVNTYSAGYTYIYYTTGPGCASITMDTVYGLPVVDSITGPSVVCVGSTITLHDITTGGTWTSGNPAVATISSTGIVSGLSVGSSLITYTKTGICGSSSAWYYITVSSTVSAGTISGPTTVAAGSTITLTESVAGGSWSSSNISIATVGVTSGIVTGVAASTVVITYTTTGCGGTAFTTTTINVTSAPPVNRISGDVIFASGVTDTLGYAKVWLITYNPSDSLLEAVDSFMGPVGTTTLHYQFLGKVTDTYRVKAAYYPSTFTGTGYIPTYHTSSNYWYSANVINHTGGTDDGNDINMGYGTVTAGAGFIGGNVSTGANKGTSGTVPAVNMLVYILNSTGAIMQFTYTDVAGHYSFSNLPVGATYTVYPEAINYATTAFTSIHLSATAPSVVAANFGQHKNARTITPNTTGIKYITSSVSTVITFPNPTSEKLNIQWNASANETANVTVSDVTGRIVTASTINMIQGNGVSQVDLSSLSNGVYMISVKSGTINYNNKIQVQK